MLLLKYGLPGLIIFAMGSYILYLHKKYGKEAKDRNDAHCDERKSLVDTLKEEQKLSRTAIDNNTAVLNQIKTLIESKK